jgi:hypothetical protein
VFPFRVGGVRFETKSALVILVATDEIDKIQPDTCCRLSPDRLEYFASPEEDSQRADFDEELRAAARRRRLIP